jgi:ArsR family transcriptional regulator, nickel/cobalt-responsive transcriptional repressor
MSQPGPRRADSEFSISEAVAKQLADTMFALSAPSRVLILGSLLDGPHSVSDLMEALGMEQSAVSHQLRVLREHNLVRAEKAGRRRLYALYDEDVAALLHAGLHHVRRDHPALKARGRGQRPAPDQATSKVS